MKEHNSTDIRLHLKPRSFSTVELLDEKIKAIAQTKMDNRHDHLNRLLEVK
jgi:uncharacterized protein YaaR (DUF327 family)